MSDRNPWRDADRARIQPERDQDNERLAHERYAQNRAQVDKNGNGPIPNQEKEPLREDHSEASGESVVADGGGQETGKTTR